MGGLCMGVCKVDLYRKRDVKRLGDGWVWVWKN